MLSQNHAPSSNNADLLEKGIRRELQPGSKTKYGDPLQVRFARRASKRQSIRCSFVEALNRCGELKREKE